MRVLVRLLIVLLLLPAACAWFERPPPPPPPVPEPPPRNHVQAVREGAAALVSAVEIVPVESPAIEPLLRESLRHSEEGNFGPAQNRIEEALKVEPENPRILQELAELKLRQKLFDQAEELARRSYNRSAQLGVLCARNWLTVAEAQLGRGENPGAARKHALACGTPPVPRF